MSSDLLDALHIERAHFCGLSMGGMTGMWLGINAPQRLARARAGNTAAQIGPPDNWNARIAKVRDGGMAAISRGGAGALVHAAVPGAESGPHRVDARR